MAGSITVLFFVNRVLAASRSALVVASSVCVEQISLVEEPSDDITLVITELLVPTHV